MPVYFSAKNLGFFHSEICSELPDDAVELTEDEYQRLMLDLSTQPAQLSADAQGRPTLIYRSQDRIKQAAWDAIQVERDRRTDQGGYKVGDKWFHSDTKSRSQQLGLVLLGANIPAGLLWKTMDGSFVTMTQHLANQILTSGAVNDQAIFAAAEAHRAAMKASDDPAGYDFSGGWPASYQDQ